MSAGYVKKKNPIFFYDSQTKSFELYHKQNEESKFSMLISQTVTLPSSRNSFSLSKLFGGWNPDRLNKKLTADC